MRENIKDRVLLFAEYINETHNTIRKTADVFGYSKSTVHSDLSKRLGNIDFDLYLKIKEILDKNFAEKHIRGGEATKHKYLR